MFTISKAKATPAVTSSSSADMGTPCKSCARCQEIFDSLSTHILSDHPIISVNDSILSNVLLNLISLLSGNATEAPIFTRPNENLAPVSVISKAEKHRSVIPTKDHNTANSFASSSSANSPALPTMAGDIANSPDMSTKLSFQPDIISTLLSSLPQQQKMQDTPPLSTNRHNLIQPKLLQVQDSLDISFMVPSHNEFQSAPGLITPDGSLTPAGISFLLANQNKSVNVSGKSDLDVADILVNKMPIPSLNKALDPSLLQLSTLYLQQLAMSQQQNSLGNHPPSAVDFTAELMNINKVDDNMNQSMGKSSTKNSDNNVEQAESLQQLIARHKQISGLIDALSSQQKHPKKNHIKPETFDSLSGSSAYTINPQGLLETSLPGISLVQNNRNSIPVSALAIPPILRQATPAPAIKTNQNVKPNLLNTSSGNDGKSKNGDKKSIPIIWEQLSSNLLNLVKQQNKEAEDDDSEIHFEETKTASSLPENVIVSSKSDLQTFQKLINEAPKSVITESKDAEVAECDTDQKLRYSSVSMVPITHFNDAEADAKQLGKAKLLYKCDVCGITFSVASTLQSHLKTHYAEKVEQCNYCQETFTNSKEYYAHVLSHRGEENVFTCQFCQKIFTSKGDFNKHVTKHTQRRPYYCTHCSKAFRDPGSLTKHERIHTGEQPYVCDICDRGFAEKSSLRKHVRVHSGEQPYKCNQCDKSFSISGNLQRHLFIHTGLRPFKCTQCSKAFNNPSHLRRHVKNLHKKSGEGGETKEASNSLVFPRILSTNTERADEGMKVE